MNKAKLKTIRRNRRKAGTRKMVFGRGDRPRLTVFRSNKHIYAQIVDDLTGKTLAAASTMDKTDKPDSGGNCGAAAAVGKRLAERASDAGIKSLVFDRNGFLYHGRIKALGDAVREGGIKF